MEVVSFLAAAPTPGRLSACFSNWPREISSSSLKKPL
jgi:hypothetical protein